MWIWLKSYGWLIYEYNLIYNPRFDIRPTHSLRCNYLPIICTVTKQSFVFLRTLTARKFHHLRPEIRDWERVPAPPTIQFRAQLAGSPGTIFHSFRSARSHMTTNRKAGGTGLVRQWGLEDGGHRIFILLFRQYIRHFFRIYQLFPCVQLTFLSNVIFDSPFYSGEFLLTRGCDTLLKNMLAFNVDKELVPLFTNKTCVLSCSDF